MIDPEILARQRIGPQPKTETKCSRCGARTRAASGLCPRCNSAEIPDMRLWSSERLMATLRACQMEAKRRRDELNAALNEREGT